MKRSENDYIIGVTGHRVLPDESVPVITQSVRDFFQEIKTTYSESRITVLSPLAEGADILCAKIAPDFGMRLVVPLPMPEHEYLMDFSDKEDFFLLTAEADDVFVVKPEEPVPARPTTGFYFRQAGLYVAKNCDVLLAIWDGIKRNSPDGAGTWATIQAARQFGKPIRQIPMYF